MTAWSHGLHPSGLTTTIFFSSHLHAKMFPDWPVSMRRLWKIPEANVHVHQDHVGGGFGQQVWH